MKSLRKKNYHLLSREKVVAEHIYVFVVLNLPSQAVEYFIVPGRVLLEETSRFSKYFLLEKMPGIHSNVLSAEGFRDAWTVFDEPPRL